MTANARIESDLNKAAAFAQACGLGPFKEERNGNGWQQGRISLWSRDESASFDEAVRAASLVHGAPIMEAQGAAYASWNLAEGRRLILASRYLGGYCFTLEDIEAQRGSRNEVRELTKVATALGIDINTTLFYENHSMPARLVFGGQSGPLLKAAGWEQHDYYWLHPECCFALCHNYGEVYMLPISECRS